MATKRQPKVLQILYKASVDDRAKLEALAALDDVPLADVLRGLVRRAYAERCERSQEAPTAA